jgi:NAD(P)H dehydrogenase (quinone)
MPTIAIIYYSGDGHTAKQAEAVQEDAAEVKGAQLSLYRIDKDGNLPERLWMRSPKQIRYSRKSRR